MIKHFSWMSAALVAAAVTSVSSVSLASSHPEAPGTASDPDVDNAPAPVDDHHDPAPVDLHHDKAPVDLHHDKAPVDNHLHLDDNHLNVDLDNPATAACHRGRRRPQLCDGAVGQAV